MDSNTQILVIFAKCTNACYVTLLNDRDMVNIIHYLVFFSRSTQQKQYSIRLLHMEDAKVLLLVGKAVCGQSKEVIQIKLQIKEHLFNQLSIIIHHVAIVHKKYIKKTTSGKPMRMHCKQQYIEGLIHEERDAK